MQNTIYTNVSIFNVDTKISTQITIVDLDKFKNFSPTIRPGDKFYIDATAKVPRFKIKELVEKLDIKIIRNHAEADHIIINPNKYFSRSHVCHVKNKLDKLGFTTPGVTSAYMKASYSSFYRVLDSADFDYVILDCFPNPSDKHNDYSEVSYKLCNERVLLSKINSTVLTARDYDRIKDLMESGDHANYVLVVEILANSDFIKSAIYILATLYNYGYLLDKLSSTKHVNFKALLNFFDFGGCSSVDSIDDIVDKLIEVNALTSANYNDTVDFLGKLVSDENHISDFSVVLDQPSEKIKLAVMNSAADNTVLLYDEDADELNPTF